MSEVLSTTEIEDRFQSEWILVGEPLIGEQLEVQGGIVLCHSKDRDEVYRHAIHSKPKSFAILYTGKLPEETAVAL
ncbi:MAG TPA: hypothetical protein PLU80_18710 [Acidobacteriota bacterium]|nr:hypothetical protein [Acidobacteriota bacterium]HNC46207.1 hypothetical protein [Acidobacteriota bacterium]HNG95129.1 hypothetical protein [Acidobacteriota bacterium]HNH84051.1 hypothetical protein [Acidobacteriota bacterium]